MPVHSMKACRRIKMLLHSLLTSKPDGNRKLHVPFPLPTGKRQAGTHWRGAWLDNRRFEEMNKSLSAAGNQNLVHPWQRILCITRTVEHNYILPISTVRIQLHVSILYVDHLQVEIFNLQISYTRCVGHFGWPGGMRSRCFLEKIHF